jgi:zinc transport system permease protein
LAAATGVPVGKVNLYFLLAFSLTVLVGLSFMGALLAGTLVIIPAATGRRMSSSLSQFLLWSCIASVVAVGSGFLIIAFVLPRFSLGPTVVIISVLFFAVSLFKKTT